MLEGITQNNHLRIATDHLAVEMMFRILFGYVRPEL